MFMTVNTVLRTMRPPFLLLTPVCVFLGASTVIANGGNLNLNLFILILSGALLAHISVNTLNEYFDFKSGLDLKTTPTPFSGGSKALPQNPGMARVVLGFGGLALLTTILIGVYFIWHVGKEIVPIGLVGVVLIATYTTWLNKNPLLCLVAPGLGFGLMVIGTQFVLQKEFTVTGWLASLVVFCLVNNLLLLNQFPDITADSDSGRRHFPIAYGVKLSSHIYAFFVLASAAIILVGSALGYFPAIAMVSLLPLLTAVFAYKGAEKYGESLGQYHKYLAANVATALLMPLLLGLTLVFGPAGQS
jgi:1,4-dihydroxy-2-naphthoate octaprenyltransferase